ncbi:hypothetical protein SAMN05443287_102656 [Micromonospora phaseoli]|uniref:Uncharacterized protein n=1 Tax=Micromonospora phaseoli TaxID=1144548 RepID=A0A1H6VEA8_9ACTN|nr:hypothetical protein [Micromonospora phaseoli]PZV93591.1 hypothetical protein CLV64_10950 [Micromonospora phaseoli]GIJ80220.1 hypothetical protein Xph01_46520 [Micromonospora phaseoli]SEJ02911.1 hypothetical protein SAMN05443287_102656 [Micromonospora phaseoli]
MTRLLSGRALLAALVVAPTLAAVTAAPASAAPADAAGDSTPGVYSDEPVDREIELARLGYRNGVRVVFSRDEESGDWGLRQDGQIDRNAPLVNDDDRTMLEAYLRITPKDVPVPRELLSEPPAGTPTPPELAGRTIAPSPVVAENLAVPSGGAATAAVSTCWDLYWNWHHWLELPGHPNPGSVFHPAKTYYSSSFGGMARYSHSYLANCGGYARHRIYYKSFGSYKKHHDYEVPDWHWQAVKKGSVHRYRKVHYDATSGDTRNGKYS